MAYSVSETPYALPGVNEMRCSKFPDASRTLTERSARLLNLTDYGLAVGNPADIVVIDAVTPEKAITEIRQPLAVYKRGRRTVVRHPSELMRPR